MRSDTKPDSHERLVNVAQASKMLGIDPATCRKWVKSGKIPGKIINEGKIKAKYVILESDVLRFMNVTRTKDINPDTVSTLEGSNRKVIKEIKQCSNRVTHLHNSLMEQVDSDRRENLSPRLELISNSQQKLNEKVNQLTIDLAEIKKILLTLSERDDILEIPDIPIIHPIIKKTVDPLQKFGGL